MLRIKGRDKSIPDKRYRSFLYSITVFYISDIMWGVFYDMGHTALVYADTILFFASMATSVLLWAQYVVAYLDKNDFSGTLLIYAARMVFAFVIFSLIINFYMPVLFSFGYDGSYQPGFSRYITLGVQFVIYITVSLYSSYNAIKSDRKDWLHHGTIAVSGLVMTLFIYLQIVFTLLPFYSVGCLLATALVHTFISEDNRVRHAKELGSEVQMRRALEEKLTLKEQLLKQERQKNRANAMITAMAADYRSVFYVNLDNDEAICYRSDGKLYGVKEGDAFSFSDIYFLYAEKYVSEEYREDFLKYIDPENIRKRLADDTVISFRYLCRLKDGDRYEMLRISRVVDLDEDADGRIHAISIGLSDVDKETRASMENNRALTDALNQAEEASAAKTSFLSSMSHEIRTPMNAIIGYNTIALNDPDISDETREYLEKMGASADHLLDLINDILDMSRIESGRMTIRNEEFSFDEMLEQINTMIRGQCEEKGLTYEFKKQDQVRDCYIGDNIKIKEIILNILGNSVKYTPAPGKVSFEVEQIAKFDDNATLRFTMKDTGVGMDNDFIPKIFNAFSQENEAGNNVYGSTGLGMAITKSLVEMMNGKISLESEKGAGTTFVVTITLKTAYSRDDDFVNEVRPKDMRVLIIDDDEIFAAQARMVMDEIGITSDVCYSGTDAFDLLKLARARQEFYDFILVDLMMPGQDDLEVTEQIRSEYGDDTVIILLTGQEGEDIADEARDAGIDSILYKPLVASEVMDRFKQIIRNRNHEEKEQKKVDLTGKHILLAEDMIINAEIMKRLLDFNKMKVDHAENGQICVDMFADSPVGTYDAVLMDIRMPVLDGLKASEAIRALDRPDAKTIPIIAMTANAFDEDVQRSLQAGMNAHLTKPVEVALLIETLQTFLA